MKPTPLSRTQITALCEKYQSRFKELDGRRGPVATHAFKAGARAVLEELERTAVAIVDARGMSGIIELPLGSVLLAATEEKP